MSAARDAWRLPATALAEAVRSGGLAVEAAVESGWAGPAAQWEADVRAVVHRDDSARAAGAAAARRLPAEAPLRGVPVLVKDNLCTTDFPTTCASRVLAGYRPEESA